MKSFVAGGRFTLVGVLIFIIGSAFAVWVSIEHQSMAGIAATAAAMLFLDDLNRKYGSPKGE